MFEVIDAEEAKSIVEENFAATCGEEEMPIESALHRVLARATVSPEDMPPFPRATMDGYAVKAEDTFGASDSFPLVLKLKGEVPMGEIPAQTVSRGETVQVATGSVLPEGADAVIMLEYIENLSSEEIMIYRAVAPGDNIIKKGEDYPANSTVLPSGHVLRAQDLGALAGLGITTVKVYRQPVVAVVSTGDEIVDCREKPGPGQIRDINTTVLSSLITTCGGVPVAMGIVPDKKERLKNSLEEAVERADIVLISGGSSVGARDVTVEAIESCENGKIYFHGIAVRPGKPTIMGQAYKKPVFGLSGNPVSAMTGFLLLVKPLIRRMSGMTRYTTCPREVTAVLQRNLPSTTGREDYYRVYLHEEGERYTAKPVLGPPGLINTMVNAHGLLRIPRNTEGLYQGEEVTVEILD